MGMDRCYGWCTMRCHEHGRIVLFHANIRRVVLRCCCPCASRMGASGFVDYRYDKLQRLCLE